MTTTIEVNRLRMRAYIGVHEQERLIGNTFEITVHLRCNIDQAIASDTLSATIDYSEVISIVKGEMSKPAQLLEYVVGRIRTALLSRFPNILGGRISLAKLTPPIPVEVESVAVTIEW